jgi:1,2-phenylacetyl-CoA epoxidase catalytic subunit
MSVRLSIFPDTVDAETRDALFDLWRVHLTSEFSQAQFEDYIWKSPSPEILLEFTQERAKRADRANELLDIAVELGMPDAAAVADRARLSGTDPIDNRLRIFTWPIHSYEECIVYRWLYNIAVVAQAMQFWGGCYVPYESWAFRHYFEVGLAEFPTRRSTAMRDLIRESFLDEHREAIQQFLELWTPRFRQCFGRTGSDNEARYVRLGLKTYSNDVVARIFLEQLADDVRHLGLDMPVVDGTRH